MTVRIHTPEIQMQPDGRYLVACKCGARLLRRFTCRDEAYEVAKFHASNPDAVLV